jgi:hypothetical protein
VSNHYAAMPSMHFGYALWVCTALAGLLKGGPFQPRSRAGWRCMLAAVGLYPASVLFCIIVSILSSFTFWVLLSLLLFLQLVCQSCFLGQQKQC